ncbi:MAG: Mbeg1-like protein [Sulfurovaceae bacterium]
MAKITAKDGAYIADFVYEDGFNAIKGNSYAINGQEYILRDERNNSTNGFDAMLLQNTSTGQYVVVFRGTEPSSKDILTDLSMGIGQFPEQFVNASDFIDNAINTYGVNESNTIIVGHSLGGSLAEYGGMKTGFQTYTYNAYGIGSIYDGIDVDKYDNIDNYITFNDFVSRLPTSEMVGNVHVVGNSLYNFGYGHSASNFTNLNIWNTIKTIDDSQDYGKSIWITFANIASDGYYIINPTQKVINDLFNSVTYDLKTLLHLSDASGLTDEQLFNALLMASVDGTYTTSALGGVLTAYNGDGQLILSWKEQPTWGDLINQNTVFFTTQGDFIGNTISFDPEGVLLDSLGSNEGVSAYLESLQELMTTNFIDTAGIYSSTFNLNSSVFDQYSVYSLDNKYYDTWNFSIDNIDELPQVQYDPDTMTITPETYNPTPNYTANNNLFSSLYVSYNDGSVGVNTTFQPYENWASVNGISIGASFGGDGYSFHVGFSWSFPVVLDLDGDGVELTSVLDSKAWFDIKGDGALHQTGWVGADDWLLAA